MSILFNNVKYRINSKKGVVSATGVRYTGRKYTAQTEAIFTRAAALGYAVPNAAVKRIIDDHIRNLIYGGIWDKLDFYLWLGYNDTTMANFAKVPWKKPFDPVSVTYGGVPYNTPGFKGSGVDGYIDTLFNPATMGYNYKLNDAFRAAIVYAAGTTTGESTALQAPIDGTAPDQGNCFFNGITALHRINNGSTSLVTGADLRGTGLKVVSRSSSSAMKLISQATVYNATSASTLITNGTQKLFRKDTTYGDSGLSAYLIGGGLTEAQFQAYRGYANTFFQNLGLPQIA